MKILLVGTFVPPEEADAYSGISIAGNQMQRGFLQGFYENGIWVEAISVTPRAMRLPGRRQEILFQKSSTEVYEGIPVHKISYVNLPFVKQFTIALQLFRKLKELLNLDAKTEKTVLCVYNSMSYFCIPVFLAARKFRVETCGIIADLPIPGARSGLLWRLEDQYEKKAISKFHKLIVLTKHIAQDFAPQVPFTVIEAGIDVQDIGRISKRSVSEQRHIVYTGTLNSLSGMELLLEVAQHFRGENVVFDIYGDGEFARALMDAEKEGLPIRYHGSVPHEQALCAQMDASILICPRLPDDFTTRYTFPSKVLEYISRGKPVICNRLAGIPDEYERLVYYPTDASSEAWVALIRQIFDHYEVCLQEAQAGRDYVKSQKNWKLCTQKALNLLQQIE